MGRTLAEKVWDAHLVRSTDGEPDARSLLAKQIFNGVRIYLSATKLLAGTASPTDREQLASN